MDKIEVSKSFIRSLKRLLVEAKEHKAEYLELNKQFEDRAKNPVAGDINTPEDNRANAWIFQGKADAYGYIAKKIENELRFYGILNE